MSLEYNIQDYLTKLISFQSITPKSNGAIEYIADLLKSVGFVTDIQIFGNCTDNLVTNLYAVYGNGRPNICFAGHVDVVSPGDVSLWQCDPFQAVQAGNIIYGRGAVDMKGAIACSLAASIEFINTHNTVNGSVSFLLTSDEEGEAKYGTRAMLEYLAHKNCKIDLAILGEPTSRAQVGDTIKVGRRGSINCDLIIYGRQGHTAYLELADNPIHHLVRIMQHLINYEFDTETHDYPKSSLAISSIDVGNTTTNVIPARATAKFNIRYNNMHSSASIIDTIHHVITKHTFKYELIHTISAEPFIQAKQGFITDFQSIVSQSIGIWPTFLNNGGTSDARFIKDYCPVVEFGLLSNTAHKTNEHTTISDLHKLYKVYYATLKWLIQ